MAGKKDPSIYDDRSNIGSSEELDEYGVWVKSEPQDLSSAMPEMEELPDFDDGISYDVPEFNDTDTSGETSDFVPEVEFEEIPEDSELPDGQNPTEVDKDGFTEVSVNDFLDDEGTEWANKSIDIGDLDSIPDLSEEVSEIPAESGASAPSGVSHNDLSNQLLMKIAEELSSIKKELSSLKSELSSARNTQTESQDAHAASGGGFFDEEDDEKIALTGDELDNILNTANFTEEAGSGESVGDGFASFESPDTENDLPLSAQPDIIGDDETPFGKEAPFEEEVPFEEEAPFKEEAPLEKEAAADLENNFDDVKPAGSFNPEPMEEISDDFDISLDLSGDISGGDTGTDAVEIPVSDSGDGLEDLREEGVKPMTRVEGDTTYLEEDPLASIPEDDQLDLSGAVIDEPDLSSRITENPIGIPAIENISIDIDMEEPEISGIENEDFNLESEETMEIPVMDEPPIDDFFPISADPLAESEPLNSAETPVSDTFAAEPPAVEESGIFAAEPPAVEESDTFAAEPPVVEESDTFAVEPPAVEESAVFEAPAPVPEPSAEPVFSPESGSDIPSSLKQELKTVLSYMDQLLESLPEDKIEEFAKSEYFDTYKKLFEELGLV